MSNFRQALIDLYSEATPAEVHESSAYKKLYDKWESVPGFKEEQDFIRELRVRIDQRLSNQRPRDQVAVALKLLHGREQPLIRQTYRELLLQSNYAKAWSPPQLQYFKEQSLVVMQGVDFFLSYTKYNPNLGQANEINRRHKSFVREALQLSLRDFERQNKSNLVAEAIHHLLVNLPSYGFYESKKHDEDNQKIKEKLKTHLDHALAFVQLVQGAIFHHDPGSNWCFFEYDVVRKSCADRILFVNIDQNFATGALNAAFQTWYDEFAHVGAVILTPTTARSQREVVNENIEKIRSTLGNQIDAAVNRVYSNVPN